MASSQLLCTKCHAEKPLDAFSLRATGCTHRLNRYQWCRECSGRVNKAYRDRPEVKEKIKQYMRTYWKNDINETHQRHRVHSARYLAKGRDIVRAHYGKVCACCGESNEKFLTIDHMDGNGAAHRRQLKHWGSGVQFYRWLVKQGLPDGYRTLCFNCNAAVGVKGACPHSLIDPMTLVGACA